MVRMVGRGFDVGSMGMNLRHSKDQYLESRRIPKLALHLRQFGQIVIMAWQPSIRVSHCVPQGY